MLLVGILLFALLVVVHELGHFIVARRNGVEVEEFGIGFPPKLLGRKIGDTEYTLNLIPLGGFVKLKGESDADERPGSFGASRLWSKAKILLAGVGMNILAAFVIILVLALTGMPSLLDGQYQVASDRRVVEERLFVAGVAEDSPADEAGIAEGTAIIAVDDRNIETADDLDSVVEDSQHETVEIQYESSDSDSVETAEVVLGNSKPGYLGIETSERDGKVRASQVLEDSAAEEIGIRENDYIVSVGGSQVTSAQQLTELTSDLAGEVTDVTYERNGQTYQGEARFGTGGVIEGAALFPEQSARYTWSAPLVAIGVTLQMVYLVLSVLGEIVAGIFSGTVNEAAEQVAGPVGVVFLFRNLGSFGWEYLYFLIASISVSLAVFNALPIPALDGGRLAVIAGARALRRQLTSKVENTIHGVGFMLLLGLLVLITYVDIQRFF